MMLRRLLHAYMQTQIAYSLSKAYEGTGLRPIGIDPVFSVQSSMFNGQVATQVEVGLRCADSKTKEQVGQKQGRQARRMYLVK
jgi:hypothetical protein